MVVVDVLVLAALAAPFHAIPAFLTAVRYGTDPPRHVLAGLALVLAAPGFATVAAANVAWTIDAVSGPVLTAVGGLGLLNPRLLPRRTAPVSSPRLERLRPEPGEEPFWHVVVARVVAAGLLVAGLYLVGTVVVDPGTTASGVPPGPRAPSVP